jgi:hypothetical protein
LCHPSALYIRLIRVSFPWTVGRGAGHETAGCVWRAWAGGGGGRCGRGPEEEECGRRKFPRRLPVYRLIDVGRCREAQAPKV